MATRPTNIIQDIDFLLVSIRSSFDVGNIDERLAEKDLEEIRRAYLLIEDIRFSFRANLKRAGKNQSLLDVLEPLQRDLRDFFGSSAIHPAHFLRYRFNRNPRDALRSGYLSKKIFSRNMSVAEAIDLFIQSIDDIPRQLPLEIEQVEVEGATARLRRILPEQKVSPVRFDIVGNKVVVDPQRAHPSSIDLESSRSARKELIERGERILRELEVSNCDPRLLESVSQIQSQLSKETDIVRLGVANLECSAMCDAFKSELPNAVGAMLRAHTLGISMYTAQFPEWSRFVDNSSSIELNSDSIKLIFNTAANLVSELIKKPNLSHPEVPKVIQYLNSFIEDPQRATSRSGLAVLRTLENFVIRIFQFGADFFDQTAKQTSKSLSAAAARVIAASLLALALSSATGISPVAVAAEGSAWLEQAAELVAKNLSEMAR